MFVGHIKQLPIWKEILLTIFLPPLL